MKQAFYTVGLAMTALAVLATATLASPARLRPDITVYDRIATVGDFFDNAGALATEPLFQAPDLGHRGSVPVARILERAGSVGLDEIDSRGLAFVSVTRASRYLTGEDFIDLARTALVARLGTVAAGDLEIETTLVPEPIHADPASAKPVVLRRLLLAGRSGRFEAQFTVDQGTRRRELVLRGIARETRQAVIVTRPIARGEIVSEQDVVVTRVHAQSVTERSAVSAEQVVGMQARRNLREHAAISTTDLRPPILVERNQSVTISYRSRFMSLSAQGRAMQAGALDDVVTILNLQSNRTIQARIVAPGEVVVSPRSLRVASKE